MTPTSIPTVSDAEVEAAARAMGSRAIARVAKAPGAERMIDKGWIVYADDARAALIAAARIRTLAAIPSGEAVADAGWLSRFTVENLNHAALDSAVGVLRTGMASGSTQQALWSAIVDYVERASPQSAPTSGTGREAALEEEEFERWAATVWTTSSPPQAAWTGWCGRAGLYPPPPLKPG